MAFELPSLSYDYNELEPHIDARTMEIHHSKHHNGYTTNLNNAIADTPLADLSIEEILMPKEILKEKLIKKYSKLKLDFTNLKQNLTDQFLELNRIASQTDKSFIGALSAQEKKQINGLNMLEKRLMKSEEKVHQDKINRVLKIRDKLFPNGKPQERISNFSEFYVNEGIDMISLIKNNLDPLSRKFSVIEF